MRNSGLGTLLGTIDSIGCDNPRQVQWKAYGENLWPFMLARETEILQGRRTARQRVRTTLSSLIQEGDKQVIATHYGAAKSRINRLLIAGYHEVLLGEVGALIDQTETETKRTADVVNGGVEKVFVGLNR